MFLAEKEMPLFKPIFSVDDRCLTTKSPLFPYGFHLYAVAVAVKKILPVSAL